MTALGDTSSPLPRLFSDLVQRYATGDTNAHNPLEGTEGPKVLATGDLNRDGLADLVSGNLDGSISDWGARGVAGFLISDRFYPTGITPVSVATADFNSDGLPDLATANLRSHDVRIRLNQGDGSFGPETSCPVNIGPAVLAAGDVNGDGTIDLVVSCLGASGVLGAAYAPSLVTLLSRGDGTFDPPVTTPVSDPYLRPFYVRLGDLSGDRKLDVAVGGINGALVVFRGKGDGTFDPGLPIGLRPDGRPLGLALGDFDRDGRVDIATSRGIVFLNESQFFAGTNAMTANAV
jgi:hypothetical protein